MQEYDDIETIHNYLLATKCKITNVVKEDNYYVFDIRKAHGNYFKLTSAITSLEHNKITIKDKSCQKFKLYIHDKYLDETITRIKEDV